MDLNYVKKLVKLLAESSVDEIEIEEEGKTIRLAKHSRNSVHVQGSALGTSMTVAAPHPSAATAPAVQSPPAPAPPAAEAKTAYLEVKSPIVGTFYRAPAPDAAPFVQVGSVVEPGMVLCIVEAMKLMNEIECDVHGKLAKILAENGQPVEYDQTLFLVEKM